MRAERVGARDAARADRARWWPRRSAAARRSSGSPTRSRRGSCPRSIAVALAHLRGVGVARPRAAPRARARQRGRRADHRLPVRARARDADVDHGGDGPRRAARACCSATPRRSSVLRAGRHAGGRQDRHAHRGHARARGASPRSRASTRPSCCGSPRASSAAASIRWPRRSWRGAEERGVALARGDRLRVASPGRACAGRVDGRDGRARQRARCCDELGVDTGAARGARRGAARATGRR